MEHVIPDQNECIAGGVMPGLKEKQYLNSSNYRSRIFLHYKFSSNRNIWPLWVFDNISKIESGKVLEIGCGNGILWKINEKSIPKEWDITLTDFSGGMLKDAEKIIGKGNGNIKFEVMDAENIQYIDRTFDIIFANHMLYHIPDRRKALMEIKRVLKDDGVFYTTTMEDGYMKEMTEIIREFRSVPPAEQAANSVIKNFSLQNGEEQLKEFFNDVKVLVYENNLEITEAGPMVDYAVSLNDITPGRIVIRDSEKEAFTEFVQNRIKRDGNIIISANAGIFINRK